MTSNTLIIDAFGSMTLLDDDEDTIWSSDADAGFMEDFPSSVFIDDEDEIDEVMQWLLDQGYTSEDGDVEVIQQNADGSEESVLYTSGTES